VLVSLILPVVLATVALFFLSFLAWMVLGLHAADWQKLPNEDAFLRGAREQGIAPGSYMFPGCKSKAEMTSPEFQEKQKVGPCGILTVFANTGMGGKLGLQFAFFLVVNFCIAYLTTLAFPAESRSNPGFMPIFRFVSTAAFMTYLTGIIPHAIWFRCRIVGHIVESIAYSAVVGAIYAAMWP
jgi:hypothetical protein